MAVVRRMVSLLSGARGAGDLVDGMVDVAGRGDKC